MAWKTELNGYVKFLRGTPAAWADLATKDTDTLYFISENNAERGKLYLGPKLISDGSITQITSLSDLQDVLISAGLPTNAILVFNSTTQQWEAKPLQYVLSAIVTPMIGATENADGVSGLVPTPLQGQQNLYLQGNGTWSDPTVDVKSELTRLKGSDTNSTIRQIAADEVAQVVANAPSSFDTLKEIADWIADHDETIDIVEVTTDVTALNNAVFGPDGNSGLVVDVQTLEDIINGTQTEQGLVTIVNNLRSNYTTLNSNVSILTGRVDDLEDSVEDIDDRLKWQDLVYEQD